MAPCRATLARRAAAPPGAARFSPSEGCSHRPWAGTAWKAAAAEEAEAAGVGPAAVAAGLVSCTVTDAVHRRAPYRSRGDRSTRNADDSIYRNGGSRSQVRVTADGRSGYIATIAMGVNR